MQRAGNRVGVDDGMRSIVVRKRASNEDWLPPKPIPSDLARVEAFALELLPDRLARISHKNRRIEAPNQAKLFCDNDFALIRGTPRCRQIVAQICLDLEGLKDARL